METALEIDKALERLTEPRKGQPKVSQWFDDYCLIAESSSALAAIHDEEDGGESQLIQIFHVP